MDMYYLHKSNQIQFLDFGFNGFMANGHMMPHVTVVLVKENLKDACISTLFPELGYLHPQLTTISLKMMPGESSLYLI